MHRSMGLSWIFWTRWSVILGEEVVSPEEFRQLLETGMTQAKVALIPPGIDQVLIGDMERTRLKDIRALFFVGVNEGMYSEKYGVRWNTDRDGQRLPGKSGD